MLIHVQYSQRGTFIWTPIIAIDLNVFAEKDHRDRWFLPIFQVVTGVAHGSEHRATRCTNTADPDCRTRWSLVINRLFYTIYMYIM